MSSQCIHFFILQLNIIVCSFICKNGFQRSPFKGPLTWVEKKIIIWTRLVDIGHIECVGLQNINNKERTFYLYNFTIVEKNHDNPRLLLSSLLAIRFCICFLFQYLEMRFNKLVRIIGCLVFQLQMVSVDNTFIYK